MPQTSVSFNGQTLFKPGAYYADFIVAQPNPLPPTPPLLVIGYGWGPKPQTVTQFSSYGDFIEAVRGGPVSALGPYIATPSPALNGTGSITFIDVSENTQATSTLQTAATGNAIIANLTSVLYGPPSNQLQRSVAAGSVAGTAITLFDGYANETYFGDNLGVPLRISYIGPAVGGATFSITGTVGAAALLTATDSATGILNVPLASYQTVAQIAEYINGTAYFSAQVLSATNGQLNPVLLDLVTSAALPAPAGGIDTFVSVTSSIPDVLLWLNSTGVVVATAAAIASSSTLVYLTSPLVHFSGATGVPPVTQDYASGFTLGLTTPAFAVVADSNLPAVRALGSQHAEMARAIPTRRWRRFYTGSTVGDSVATAVAAAASLDSLSTIYCHPGLIVTSTQTGLPTAIGGLYAGVAAAAIACGNPANTPITNKPLPGSGPEVFLTDSQLATLLSSGVCPIAITDQSSVPRFVRDITTWLADSNVANFTEQQVKERDYLAYSLVNAMQPYIGTIASTQDEILIANAVKKTLNALLYSKNKAGVLNAWDSSSLVLVYTGSNELANVSVNATLLGQNVFITMSVGLEELDITVTIAAAS